MERTQSFLLKYRRYAGAAARVPATVVGAASGQRVSENQGKPQQARELLHASRAGFWLFRRSRNTLGRCNYAEIADTNLVEQKAIEQG